MTPADHMLPPDNFQEDPVPVARPPHLADQSRPVSSVRRRAPAISAWLGTIDAVERLEATLATMGSLARFRGHFYNWYDTRDLRPLDPPYVSSVDSGNLAGHLIALANACREWTVLTPDRCAAPRRHRGRARSRARSGGPVARRAPNPDRDVAPARRRARRARGRRATDGRGR